MSTPHAAPPPPRKAPESQPWTPSANGGARQESPWAATRRPKGERVTTRQRRVVEDLPDWEPLPPGETVVRRPGSSA